MKQETIFLVYEYDKWLQNKKLIYIGTDKDDCIAQIGGYAGLTEQQKKQLNSSMHIQCYDKGCEYLIEEQLTNAFTL